MDKHGWKIIHKSMMFPPWLRGFSTIDEPASFHLWPKVCKVCPGEKKKLKNTETQMAKITQKSWSIHILPIFYMFLWCLAIFCPFFLARNIMAKTGRDTQPWPPWQGATRVLESERWRQWPPK